MIVGHVTNDRTEQNINFIQMFTVLTVIINQTYHIHTYIYTIIAFN